MDLSDAGLRAWDIPHPKLWGLKIASGEIPWSGSEHIDAHADLEECIMLGLRLREGLDLAALPTSADTADLKAEGLVERVGTRLVPTLKGRLLNDLLIQRLFDRLDL